MAAHKWWRIEIAAAAGGYCLLGEVAFLDAAGANLSSGGTAYASSFYGSGYEPARAFDKNNSTEWCSAYNDFPARLWYQHTAPFEVAGVRLRGTNATYLPIRAADVSLAWSDNGSNWYPAYDDEHVLSLTDGSFAANTDATLTITPAPQAYPERAMTIAQDWQWGQEANVRGIIAPNNRVFAKASATAPEVPLPGALVRLHRRLDGRLAWQGLSDAQGYYHPRHLEVGVEYIPLAIDPSGTHECVAAGPVVAVEAA